jgi:hypothetical protein
MPAALQTINMAGQSAGWTGAFFEDDQSVVLDSAGNILHCPDNLDRYLIRTIHYPGGTVVPVTTAEFWRRVASSRGKQAMQWIQDMGETSRVNADQTDAKFPEEASQIISLVLSGRQQISNQELEFLLAFEKLKSLDLSGTPISRLPDLIALKELEHLDLSQTQASDFGIVRGLTNLKALALNGCSFESSQLETLGSLRSLESLSLAGCVIDDFGLLELQRIQNLKALDLSNSSVSPTAVAKLQEKLPNCSIRFKPD